MEENDNRILYLNMSIGTLGLIIIGVEFAKYWGNIGGTGPSLALLGFPLSMIYLYFLERKAGISKKILRIRSIIAFLLTLIIYINFFN